MINRYTIGGVAFLVDEELPGLDTEGFADATLRASFSDDADHRGMRSVSGPMELTATIGVSDRRCVLPNCSADPIDRAWQLQQMAPILSAAMDRLVLHAGAVEVGGTAVAFVGESGAGKSTLARFLASRGHRFAADDLLPVRFDPGACIPIEDRLVSLGAITFPRRETIGAPVVATLAGTDALQRLALHGFGEHGDPLSWAFQFDGYHRLVGSVPIFDLIVPNDLAALPLVERALMELVHALPSAGGAA